MKVLGVYGKTFQAHIGVMCYLHIFKSFVKLLDVIVKILELQCVICRCY